MLIELAPLFLALPTLLVSLSLTFNTLENVFSYSFLAFFQSMMLASLTLLFVLLSIQYIAVQDKYISDPLDDPETEENNTKLGVFNSIIYLWIPLVSLYLSNIFIGPLRLISLLVISQLLTVSHKSSHRSFQMENNYNLTDNSYFRLFYSKSQLYIIFLLSIVFDIVTDIYLKNQQLERHFLGYLFLILPYFSSVLNKNGNNKIVNNNQIPRINKFHSFIILFSLLKIVYTYYETYNFRMLLVSIGSLIVLIFSQIENIKLNNLNIQNFLKNFTDANLFIEYYKINYLILTSIILMIIFLHESVAPDFAFVHALTKFFSYNLFSIIFSTSLIFLVRINTSNLLFKSEPRNLNEMKPNKNTSFFSLFLQLVNSEGSKSIFNFLLLNIAFMFIQLLYSFRSRSLSLLSDSLHMLLDCVSLFLGLMASVISKNNIQNPNKNYSFGLTRIGTLSGFTNGSLLLGIVFGIFNESIQRFFNPVILENTTELLIVSALGFLVNLVGIFAFNHGHDHSHGHSHGHSHSHDHSHTHSNQETHNESKHRHTKDQNNEDHKHERSHDEVDNHHQINLDPSDIDSKHEKEELIENNKFNFDQHNETDDADKCDYDDDNDNDNGTNSSLNEDDNMQGIFLHIMADTLGSVGVIISTIIIKITGWNFVDPLASILIATLILLSSIPLLKSSSSNLLLSLNDDTEEELKYLLNEVLKISGVKSYTTPRFWPQDGPNSKLVGYLHVQYYRTENSLHIKTKIDRLFDKSSIIKNFHLQLENEVDECWCRKAGVFSTN
jgi:zinc transporter 5/7